MLSTSRIQRPDRRQQLDGLHQALKATFPANSAKPTSKLPRRPRVTLSKKSAPRRNGLVDGAPSALSEQMPKTPPYRYRLQQGGSNKNSQRPRFSKVQTVFRKTLQVAITKACPNRLIDCRSGCLKMCKNTTPYFASAAICISLNRAKSALIKTAHQTCIVLNGLKI